MDPTSFSTFGALLRYLRRRAQMTQFELGVIVGYSKTFITRLEGDSRLPDPVVIRAHFIDALHLHNAPRLAQQLIALAEAAHQRPNHESMASALGRDSAYTNLQLQLTSFVGRQRDLAEVTRLLSESRLVTLTGSGGIGKTRLAIELGRRLRGEYPAGAWLVELASLTDPPQVPFTLTQIFGLPIQSNRSTMETLTTYLANKSALIVLDNCEHLVGACAELAAGLLRACPGLSILATSREGLNISGEVTWRVPPLAVDEAVQLFAERAIAAKPGFAVTAVNRNGVERICQRLDDMPLAIELAAAKVRAFSVEQLASRMDNVFRH